MFFGLVLFEPAKSAEPPIKLGNLFMMFKSISDDFLVANGSKFLNIRSYFSIIF